MRVSLLTLFIALSSIAFSQSKLTIEFVDLENRDGQMMIALRNQDGEDIKQAILEIPKSGVVKYTFTGIDNGRYAVACYHDENKNGELDKSFVGIPTEEYGFSNDARGSFGPPDLADQLFNVSGSTSIRITLQ